MPGSKLLLLLAACVATFAQDAGRLGSAQIPLLKTSTGKVAKKPNIIFILSDDQDGRLGSLDYMSSLQKNLVGEGVRIDNHFVTVAQCCPSRTTLFRGQAAHNTNVTHVMSPGGAWSKFISSGENDNHLPHWLKKAGYTSAFLGKFLNEYLMSNYNPPPKGWDWTDALIDPYTYEFNNVVMSQNGERPLLYRGWHQMDVLRIKALERIRHYASQEKPFFIEVAPAVPHNRGGGEPTVPLTRHRYQFGNVIAPRQPNYNPPDKFQSGKSSWVRDMPPMNQNLKWISDESMRSRLRGLQGIDEMIEDMIELLKEEGILDNTYIIYTSDNGFHLGSHRLPAGKGMPYIEDTNVPFVVRGPGIPAGKISNIPSTHIDFAPTVLDIAGLPREEWPPFLDGRSLLKEWQDPDAVTNDDGIAREVLNVEFWGSVNVPAGQWSKRHGQTSYKSLRIVSEQQAWLFARWCTNNQTELYNTLTDPYELVNLAINPSAQIKRIMSRLSGLLLVTKSCGQDSCRKPWKVLSDDCGCSFTNLEQAMHPEYDSFFESLPEWGFQRCLPIQYTHNEGPYYPPESISLGAQYRNDTGRYFYLRHNNTLALGSIGQNGGLEQRHRSLSDVMNDARPLTDDEVGVPVGKCGWPGYCRGFQPHQFPGDDFPVLTEEAEDGDDPLPPELEALLSSSSY